VVVQRDNAGRRKLRPLGDEHERRHPKIGRGLEREALLDVIVAFRATDDPGIGRDRRRRVKQAIEHQRPGLLLPRLQGPEFGPQKRQIEL
jgi:hypothetical protein